MNILYPTSNKAPLESNHLTLEKLSVASMPPSRVEAYKPPQGVPYCFSTLLYRNLVEILLFQIRRLGTLIRMKTVSRGYE